MNINYFKMFVAVTAAVLCTSISVRAEQTPVVRHVSGEIVWIDAKLGKMQLKSDTSDGARETTEYKINQDETRVTDSSDKKFLVIKDLRAGQYVTIDVIEGQEGKIVKKITTELLPAPMLLPADDKVIALRLTMRKLWEDHITYTRNYIISASAGLEDEGTVAQRLLRNQDDIGDAIKPYYGEEAGKKLTALLRDHIMIATEVVKAAETDNNEELIKVQTKWNGNADDIATFLSSANPNWAGNNMTAMLHKHLEYTTAEVVSRLKEDWPADINAYDHGHRHMLMFADILTEGMVKQFPEKFAQ